MNFEIPLRKLRINMNKWNKHHLSLTARVVVMKTFLFSVFTHILNTVYIHSDQLSFVQKLLNEFLWKGRNRITPSVANASL